MDNFRISKLEVNNIGPFGHLELDFPEKPAGMSDRAEIHILTGENGTGKTTVLEMLAAAPLNSPTNLSQKSRFSDPRSDFYIRYEPSGSARGTSVGSRPKFDSEQLRDYIDSLNGVNKTYKLALFAYSGHRHIKRAHLEGINDIKSNPFEEALNFQNPIQSDRILQWIANTITKEALAKNQSDFELARQFRFSITNLENIIGQIIEKPIRFLLRYEPLNVVIEVDHETLDFNLLPDGLKSIISWIADLLMRMDRVKWENDTPVFERNFILFLDEIEVHLHPAWQRKILPAVQKLFPNAQIFISTHSPFVVGSVDGAWIHKFVKPNGDSRLAGPPILSEDAKSFRYWLEEVFDIKKEFGEGAQRQLDRFYDLRNRLLVNGTPQEREEFIHIAGDLSRQSPEMESIISWEIRQFNKRSPQPVSI